MQKLILAVLLILCFEKTACAAKPFTVPVKENLPYYERTFAITGKPDEPLLSAKLFFSEYFKRSAPQVVIDDKAAGRYAVRTTLFYHFLDNPETYRGRLLSLMDISFHGDSCTVMLYDWQVERAALKSRWKATPMGWVPDGEQTWTARNEAELLKGAGEGRYAPVQELAAIDKEVVKLLDAFEKRVGRNSGL